jgi:Rrf2 family protein
MLSQTGEYALRSVLYMARRGQESTPAAEIAEFLGLPEKYLAHVLNDLAGSGIVESTRGRHGGFRLARPAEALTLVEVVAPFDPTGQPRPCLLQDRLCGLGEPCVAHERWMGVAADVRSFFERTTVADLLVKELAREIDGA